MAPRITAAAAARPGASLGTHVRLYALELAFAERNLRRLCEREAVAKLAFGPEVAAALKARIADLNAADTASDLPYPLNAEVGSQPATVLLALVDGFQIRLRSNHQQHRAIDGVPDWSTVRRVQITAIGRLP